MPFPESPTPTRTDSFLKLSATTHPRSGRLGAQKWVSLGSAGILFVTAFLLTVTSVR
jgi:hypothetical protein